MSTPSLVERSGLVYFGVAISLGLILSAGIMARTFERVKSANQTISVKGYAEKAITSDKAAWSGAFSTRAPQLPAAYDKLQTDLEKVLSLLQKHGLAPSQVDVSSVSTQMIYKMNEKGMGTNEIEGYILSQSVDVLSSDVKLVSALATDSSSLIKDDVQFHSGTPQYFYTKLEDLKVEMLAAATKDARRRAEEIARNSGCRVGKPRSAEQGVFQITTPYSTDVSGGGIYDTSTVDKVIKAIVTVEYSIE